MAHPRGPAAKAIVSMVPGDGELWLRFSDDCGRTFPRTQQVDVTPFQGGYGMRGGQLLPDGSILLALGDTHRSRAAFAIRSFDGGANWSKPAMIAEKDNLEFEKPG